MRSRPGPWLQLAALAGVAGTLLSWRFGGLRAAVWAGAAFASFAVSGLWLESMETLALRFAFLCGTLALRSLLFPQCDTGLHKLLLHRIDGPTVRLCPGLRFFELRATQ